MWCWTSIVYSAIKANSGFLVAAKLLLAFTTTTTSFKSCKTKRITAIKGKGENRNWSVSQYYLKTRTAFDLSPFDRGSGGTRDKFFPTYWGKPTQKKGMCAISTFSWSVTALCLYCIHSLLLRAPHQLYIAPSKHEARVLSLCSGQRFKMPAVVKPRG